MEATISCLCGDINQTISLAASSTPVKTHLCHCSSCRYSSGVLCTSYLEMSSQPQRTNHLKSYATSKHLTRFFCNRCGAHAFAFCDDRYAVAAGLIQYGSDVLEIVQHEFVEDTIDGGLASFFTRAEGRAVPAYIHGPDSAAASLVFEASDERPNREEVLHARCHCGCVQYRITRPTVASRQLSSPWPDLLVPYHTGIRENAQDRKWWLRGVADTRYLAGLCTCRSCRLAAGQPVQAWAFVPKCNILKADGTPMDFEWEDLQRYESSIGVFREFCGTCGATAFWHCDERPELIDVSVGLLRAKEGARATSWLEWELGRVSFAEEAQNNKLVTALKEGLQSYGSNPAFHDFG